MSGDDQNNCTSKLSHDQPFQIETRRLCLIPLTARQLRLWIDHPSELERELNCVYRAEPLQGDFLNIVKSQADSTDRDPDNYCFHSFWFIVRKSDRLVVGDADFKNLPDVNQSVEIGYGLGTDFEHQGYMTETVEAMCDWALARSDVASVIAETYHDGYASQSVLTRCGFQRFERTNGGKHTTYWWIKTK